MKTVPATIRISIFPDTGLRGGNLRSKVGWVRAAADPYLCWSEPSGKLQ